jgi:hypothetical protein
MFIGFDSENNRITGYLFSCNVNKEEGFDNANLPKTPV